MSWTSLETTPAGFVLSGGSRTMPSRLRASRAELDHLAAEGRLDGEARTGYERLSASASPTSPRRGAPAPRPPTGPRSRAFAESVRRIGDEVAREACVGAHPEATAASGQDFATQTRRAGDYAARFAGLR